MFVYMSGVLSTIEKQFEIKSEHSAYMMSGNEFSQILMIFFLPAFAKVRRTPLWIAVGMTKALIPFDIFTYIIVIKIGHKCTLAVPKFILQKLSGIKC